MLFQRFLNRLIQVGTLTVITSTGRSLKFGDGGTPRATVRLHDAFLPLSLALHPGMRAGEAYVDGRLTVEDGDLYDFLDLVGRNLEAAGLASPSPINDLPGRLIRRLHQYNPVEQARKNVRHHYDLSGELYDLFLDTDRQYSCAYFTDDHGDLERAQEDKKRHIAAKLLIKPEHRVLDIGSGWGGLGLHLARTGADVTGLTLSEEQLKVAQERARTEGLQGHAHFHLRDYRRQTGTFDRIVSVGMFEHVGVNHFREYFAKIKDLLTDDGVAVLHTIGRAEGPGITNPWIRRYIFPGGYIPALSEVMTSIERTGLWATDVEILRLHYAETLRQWRLRFQANREQALELYDERFCRMWEFYLAICEVSFRYLRNVVFQIQLAKHQDTVPVTRDYMVHHDAPSDRDADDNDRRAA
jgi:cyclopropane-fatty-acyl-phospholipid synthase